jgi:hypothetical protein
MDLTKKSVVDIFPEEIDIGVLMSSSAGSIALRYLEESREKGKAIMIRSQRDYLAIRNTGYRVAAEMGGKCKIFRMKNGEETVRYVAFLSEENLKAMSDGRRKGKKWA